MDEYNQVSGQEFFCYDDGYARKNKTRRLKPLRSAAVLLSFTICAVLFLSSFLLTDTKAFDDPAGFPFIIALIVILMVSTVVVPMRVSKNFRLYMDAVYSAFVQTKEGIWYIRLTPKQASGTAAALNQSYMANTWATAQSREACLELINNERCGLSVKHEFFKKPSVRLLQDLYAEKHGKQMVLTYHNAKGRSRRMVIPDSFPGLPEYLKAEKK